MLRGIFMDCTAQVNKQKREVFFSVNCTPSGKCYLSVTTVILSGNNYIYDSHILVAVGLFPIRKVVGVQVHIQGCFPLFIWIIDCPKYDDNVT